MSKKTKIIAFVLLVVVVLAGVYFWKFSGKLSSNNVKRVSDGGLIDEYNKQLSDLKKQAKSGKPEDLQNYGIAQYATGDITGAIETYRKQLEKDPNNILAHSGLANALRDDKQYDKAIEEYYKVIELDNKKVSAYSNLASVYQYSLKQMDNAVKVYKQGIDNTSSVDLYVLLAMTYEQSGNNAEAIATYKKVMEMSPANPVAKAALERLEK